MFELNFTYQDSEAGLRNMLRADPFTSYRTMFLVTVEMEYPELEDEAGGASRLGGRGGASGLEGEEEEEEPGTESGGSPAGGDGGDDDGDG